MTLRTDDTSYFMAAAVEHHKRCLALKRALADIERLLLYALDRDQANAGAWVWVAEAHDVARQTLKDLEAA